MARQLKRRLRWAVAPGTTHSNVHIAPASDAAFLEEIDSGSRPPKVRLPVQDIAVEQGVELALLAGDAPPGVYQFAIVAEDADSGKFSDPYQASVWVAVPLDLTPLSPPFGGRIEVY